MANLLQEDEVCETVLNWLESRHKPPKIIVKTAVGYEGTDLRVYTPEKHEGKTVDHYHLQIECKGSKGSYYDGLGKSLRYYTMWDGLLTYIAVPEDHQNLKKLEDLLKFMNLPIGLYVVHETGEIEERKVAQGKDRVSKTREL